MDARQWTCWWESLKWLDRNAAVGAASARAFAWIWLHCGARPCEYEFYLPDLAERFGKTVGAAKKWLERLQEAELIYVTNCTIRAAVPEGLIKLYVLHPNPAVRGRPDRVDPQRRFAFMDQECKRPDVAQVKRPDVSQVKRQTFAKKPGRDAVLSAVAAEKLSMAQAFASISDGSQTGRGPPRGNGRAPPPYIGYQKSRNSKSDIETGWTEQEACEEIFRVAADPLLKPIPIRKVARKIAAGLMPVEDLYHMVDLAREAVESGKYPHRFVYLIGAFRGYFKKRGWEWRKHR